MSALTIDVPPRLRERLAQEAAEHGWDVEEYSRRLLEALFQKDAAPMRATLREGLKPGEASPISGRYIHVGPTSGIKSALGKYADVPTSSEAFAARKQEEKIRENRSR